MTFPQVGAQATLLGAATFNQQAQQVIASMNQINAASRSMASGTSSAFGSTGNIIKGAIIAMGVRAVIHEMQDLASAVIDVGVNVVKMGADFDYIMGQVSASLQATTADAQSLQETIFGVAQKSSSALNDITKATGDLGKAGVSLTDIQDGAAQALNNFTDAAAGDVSSMDAANLIAAAHNATGEKFVTIVNQMTGAVIKSTASYRDMVTGGAQAVSTMTALGFTFLDVATALAEMSNAGIIGGRGGASLKSFFLSLESPSKEAKKLMDEFGLSLYDAAGNVAPITELIRRLTDSFGPLARAAGKSPQEINDALSRIFPGDAIRTAQVLIDQGVAGWQALQAGIASVDTETLANEVRDSLNPQLQALKNTVAIVAVIFTQQFLPVLKDAAIAVNHLLQRLDPTIPKAFGEAIKSILTGKLELPSLKAPKLDVGGQTMAAGLVGSFQSVLGPMGTVVDQIVAMFMRIRAAVSEQLIPSIIYFKNALMGTTTSAQAASSVVGFLSDNFVSLIGTVSAAFYWAGRFAVAIRESANAGLVLGTVLKGFVAASLIGVALLTLRVTTAFALMAVNAAASIAVTIAQMALFAAQSLVYLPLILFQIGRIAVAWGITAATSAISMGVYIVSMVAAAAATVASATTSAIAFGFMAAAAVASATATAMAWIAAAAPLLLIIAGIGLAVAVLAVAWANNWLGMRTAVTNSINLSIQSINTVIGFIRSNLPAALNWLSGFWASMWDSLAQTASSAWSIITTLVGQGVELVLNAIQGFGSLATGVWNKIWSAIGETLVTWANAAGTVLKAIFDWIGSTLQTTGEYWTSIWVAIWTAVRDVLNSAATIITGIIADVLNWIPGAINTAGQAISAAWTAVWNALTQIVGNAIKLISDKISGLMSALGGVTIFGVNVGSAVGGLFKGIGGAIGEVTNVFNAVGGAAVTAFNAGKGAAEDLGKVVGDLFSGTTDLSKAFDGLGLNLDSLFDFKKSATINDWMKNIQNAYDRMKTMWGVLHPDPYTGGIPAPGGGDDGGGGGGGGGGGAGKKPGGGAGGAESAADALERIKDAVAAVTDEIPGMTSALQDFLVELEKATPGRLAGMVAAIKESSVLIGNMLMASLAINAARMELIGVEQKLAVIAGQQAILEDQRRLAEIPFERELLALKRQQLALDMQMAPIQRQIYLVDQQIAALGREDFALTEARARLDYAALPIRQKIAAIERQITDTVDKRLALTQRESEIRNQLSLNAVDAQMRSTTKALDDAWERQDVSSILKLEDTQAALEDQKSAIEDRLSAIQAETEQTRLLDELKTIGLEREKLAILDTLKPLEDKMRVIDETVALTTALNAISIAQLGAQKQQLEDILLPLQEQRALIEYQMSLVDLQRQQAMTFFDEQKLGYDELAAKEKLRQDELNQTILLQEQAFADLILQFASALTASGAFTLEESVEVAKRMGFWNEQVQKIAEVAVAFDHARGEVAKLTAAIQAIPTDVTVTIHVNTVETTTGSSSAAPPSFADGGVVPGPYGKPRLVIAHGGERFMGMHASTPTSVRAAQSVNMSRSSTTNTTSADTINLYPPAGMSKLEQQQWKYRVQDVISKSRR